MKVTLRIGAAERSAEVTRRDGQIVVRLGPIAGDGAAATPPPAAPDDAPATALLVRPQRDGTWTLVDAADEGRRIPLAGTAQGTARQIWTAGRTLRYGRVVAGGAARHAADAAGLAAAIPSVVLDVLVAPGDSVADGQKLILLESMKMVVAIQAPFAGVVTAVHCAKGDAVQPGVALLAVDPTAAATAAT